MANASQNNVVLEYISKLGENLNSYMMLYLSLSLVSKKVLTEQTLSSLRDVFAQQIKDGNAKLFDIPNSDIAVIFNKSVKDEILSSLVKIKLLLQEDESVAKVAYLQESPIAVFWDLVREYGAVSEKLSQVYDKSSQEQDKKSTVVASNSFFNTKPHHAGEALTTAMLDKVQKIITVSDFSSFIRRQPICAVIGKSMPQRVFEEVYVSIPDMRDSLLPGVDLFANEWLFLALTETLDRRVLEIVSRHDDGAL